MPEEPPPTPEGDLEALAAVERIRTMFADVDPEVWRDVVELQPVASEATGCLVATHPPKPLTLPRVVLNHPANRLRLRKQ